MRWCGLGAHGGAEFRRDDLPPEVIQHGRSVTQALGDALLPAQLGDTVLAAQAFQHNPDIVFRREMPPGRPTDVLDHLLRRPLGGQFRFGGIGSQPPLWAIGADGGQTGR